MTGTAVRTKKFFPIINFLLSKAFQTMTTSPVSTPALPLIPYFTGRQVSVFLYSASHVPIQSSDTFPCQEGSKGSQFFPSFLLVCLFLVHQAMHVYFLKFFFLRKCGK